MKTTLTNKREFLSVETIDNALKLTGEITISEQGSILNYNGSVTKVGDSEGMEHIASFGYSNDGVNTSRNIYAPAEYDEEINALLSLSLHEVKELIITEN